MRPERLCGHVRRPRPIRRDVAATSRTACAHPTTNTCGTPQACNLNGCDGTFDANSAVAHCRRNFRDCECIPDSSSCGTAQSCDLNGCNGGFDYNSNTARCRGNFKGCVCNPTPGTCGPPQHCDAGGCGGTLDNRETRAATCKAAYRGCQCTAVPGTTGGCGTLGSCNFGDCQALTTSGSNLGVCQAGPNVGCGCIPQPGGCPIPGCNQGPPPPPPPGRPTECKVG